MGCIPTSGRWEASVSWSGRAQPSVRVPVSARWGMPRRGVQEGAGRCQVRLGVLCLAQEGMAPQEDLSPTCAGRLPHPREVTVACFLKAGRATCQVTADQQGRTAQPCAVAQGGGRSGGGLAEEILLYPEIRPWKCKDHRVKENPFLITLKPQGHRKISTERLLRGLKARPRWRPLHSL